MHYANVLGDFKTDYNDYVLLKKLTSKEVPLVSYEDKDRKIIKWVPLFEESLSRTFGRKCPLVYIVREKSEVPNVRDVILTENSNYGA